MSIIKQSRPYGNRASGNQPSPALPARSRQRGQALLELALLLPLLLLLTIGIIEIGRLAYYSIEVSNAARSGAQYGTQSLAAAANNANITTAAQNDVPDIGNSMTVSSTQTCGCAADTLGACPVGGGACTYPMVYLRVTTQYTLNSLFNYPGIPNSFTVTGNFAMPVRQ
jgi:Flp pilus assembly protein TadG